MPTDLVQSYRIDATDLPCEAVIFGCTAAMREVRCQIERILHNDLPVLIRGESGTGKEVIAKFLHVRSDRRDSPFVKVNCAALPARLLEGELFGNGGSNAASALQRGLVEAAAGGTLFLDEIGDMEWDLQTKLLDLLEDGQAHAASGEDRNRPRVRVVCSTNRDLEAAVERRAFRRDLFYRIEVINLNLAPLRERIEDLPQLCEHFLEKLARQFGKPVPALSPGAMQLMKQSSWPGNLRELENRIARLIVLGDGGALGATLRRKVDPAGAGSETPARKRRLQVAAPAGRAVLLRALRTSGWNRRKAAEALNLGYGSFLNKLREAGVWRRRRGRRPLRQKPGPR
jgi:two-component system, NtrC family, response regulator AtoC